MPFQRWRIMGNAVLLRVLRKKVLNITKLPVFSILKCTSSYRKRQTPRNRDLSLVLNF